MRIHPLQQGACKTRLANCSYRRLLQHVPAARFQPVQARQHDPFYGVRDRGHHRLIHSRGSELPVAIVAHDDAGLTQRLDKLFGKKWVALRLAPHYLGQVRRQFFGL